MPEFNIEKITQIILDKSIALLILFASFFFIEKLVLKYIKQFYKKRIRPHTLDQRADTLYKVFISCTHYTLYFLVGYATLSILGFPMATLIAGAGIAGLVIGLGAQGFINDLVNGIFILIERQYDVDDIVIISGMEGRVKSIGLRLTTLIGYDGATYFIRNKDISSVKNLSKNHYRLVINLYLTNPSDITHIPAVLNTTSETILQRFPEIPEKPTPIGAQVAANGQLYYSIAVLVPIHKVHHIQSALYETYITALNNTNIKVFAK